jgi:hypothetical protein
MAYLSQEFGIYMSNNINNIKQTQYKQQQTSTPNNTVTSTSTWSNVTKKPPAMRVDPSDGKAYPFASFRKVYGKDADRLWRLAGEARAFRARQARKPDGLKKVDEVDTNITAASQDRYAARVAAATASGVPKFAPPPPPPPPSFQGGFG